jgi:hypothetical protein
MGALANVSHRRRRASATASAHHEGNQHGAAKN